MRRALLAVLLVPALAHADPADVRGRVVDATTGTAIAGATVTGDDGTAVETGPDGGFVLHAVTASLAVYADRFAPALIDVGDGEPLLVQLAVSSDDVEIIHVSGEIPDGASPTGYSLSRDQIRALPGGGNDALRAIQSLPGVSRVSYGLGGIVLRGATPGHNGVYVDDIEVPLAFHFGGVTAIYPSTLLDEVVVTPGGSDVAFGGNTGGLVELRGRAPRADRWRSGAELGLLDASVYTEGATPANGAILIGLRRSYADVILGAILPDDEMVLPRYYDGQLRWQRGNLTVMGFFSDDRIAGWGGTDFRHRFVRGAVRYRRSFGHATVTVLPWAGVSSFRLDLEDENSYRQRNQIDHAPLGLRADVVRDTRWGHVAAGVDLRDSRVLLVTSNTDPDSTDSKRTAGWITALGAWVEARWRIADGKLTLKPGLRVDHYGAGTGSGWVIEPRTVTTHELARWLTLREEIGVYHQAPGGTATNGDGEQPERGVHASVGARLELAGVVASITGYHAVVSGPPLPRDTEVSPLGVSTGLGIVLDNLASEQFGGIELGRRRASGVELSVQRRTRRWMLWLAYTLSRSERHDGPVTLEGWYPMWLDQTHNLNAVASVRLGGWQLGARLRWATGLPYTPLISGSGGILDNNVWGPQNSAQLPDFVSLDLRVDRTWRRGWGAIGVYLDVQNVTNSRNPEGIYYEEGKPHLMRGLPVLPMIGVSYTPPD